MALARRESRDSRRVWRMTDRGPKPQDPDGKAETLLVLGTEVFAPGQVTLSERARTSVGDIVPILKERSGARVSVEGHSDTYSVRSNAAQAAEEHQIFSVRRARAVARFLEQQGIAADRIVVRGYGATRPVASNATQNGRAQNRRVEIKLVPSLQEQ